jgi:chorismate-pyruvate lyase
MPRMKSVHGVLSTLPGLLLGVSATGNAGAIHDDVASIWPNTFLARVEVLALLQTLNANLLGHDSATQILGEWCREHRLAADPRIVVQRVHDAPLPASEEQRRNLRVAPADEVRFRHVRLLCGSLVLSEADNWYVPGRLTAAMNQQLETTDAPFGAVVHELHFQRHTLAARLLWQPLEPGWEMAANSEPARTAQLIVPERVLEHRAVLSLPDGMPISEVIETYTGNVLAFAPPASAAGP